MRPHALPKQRRVRKRREYLAAQGKGSRIALSTCILLLLARSDNGPARMGVTVTRKFGGAVQRNRAKRVVREAFRLTPDLFPKGIDLVVIPKAQRAFSTAQLIEEWRRAARLIAARAESLHRELAKTPDTTQTARPGGSTGSPPDRTP